MDAALWERGQGSSDGEVSDEACHLVFYDDLELGMALQIVLLPR
jgi:hypothetical protein